MKKIFKSDNLCTLNKYGVHTVSAYKEIRKIGKSLVPHFLRLAEEGWSYEQILYMVIDATDAIKFGTLGVGKKENLRKSILACLNIRHGDE